MKTIMLCLNKLGIGGIETAVYNQVIQLIKKNYRVIILAKNGIYKEKFEKEGAICIDFDFAVKSKCYLDKINQVIKIVQEYNVEQIHIHQFDCIDVMFPVSFFTNIPYVAYVHTGIFKVYDDFEKSYKVKFKLFFDHAEKIVAITESAKNENMKYFNINPNKYIVIRNSINFERLPKLDEKVISKINNILIISRLGKEKMFSIENGIKIFEKYLKINNNAILTIVGDGLCRKDVENKIKKIEKNVKMFGERNDVLNIIKDNDLVIGLDRCILESIVMKKIAIISGYDGIKGIVTPELIDKAANINFSGWKMENQDIDKVVENIADLNENKIKNILEKNYEYAYENLNFNKNIYVITDAKDKNVEIDSKELMERIMELQNIYSDVVNKMDNDWKEWLKAKEWFNGQIEVRDKKIISKDRQINELKMQLNQIYNSKSWKFINKIKSKFIK